MSSRTFHPVDPRSFIYYLKLVILLFIKKSTKPAQLLTSNEASKFGNEI